MAEQERAVRTRQRQERSVKTRRELVTAAGAVFGESGFRGASIEEIARLAGSSKGKLYHQYPGGKEDLADAVVAAQDEALVVPECQSWLQRVIDLSFLFARQLRHDPVLQGVVRLAVEQYYKPKPDPWVSPKELLVKLLKEADANGELLPGIDHDMFAENFQACFTGLQIRSQVASDRADLPKRLAYLWGLLLPITAKPGVLAHLVIDGKPVKAADPAD